MARKLVEFTQGYSRYNKGETAAFDAGFAKKLTEGKGKVGKMIGDVAEPVEGNISMPAGANAKQAQTMIDNAKAELQAGATDLSKRESALHDSQIELNIREADLVEREADLTSREAALKVAEPASETKGKDTATKTKGDPPKQGAMK